MTQNTDVRIPAARLRAYMERVFAAEGFDGGEAAQIADVLMQADLFGIESHGAQRMMYYHRNLASGSAIAGARPEVIRETPVSALIDGHFAMGQLCGCEAMRLAIRKAKQTGVGICAVRNSSHYGIAGYYTLMAAKEGLASFSMTNTGPIMTPTFGVEMMLGTNPIAFCMPADPIPFWFDASTTVVTLGKVEVHAKRGRPMPEGWTIGGDGHACTDAAQMNASILAGEPGGILPLGGAGETHGGHKGYGLGIMVEALTGVLAQGLTAPDMQGAHGDHTSHFFLAFDPAMFGDPAQIRAGMSAYLERLRAGARAEGCARIYTPGEKAHEAMADRLQNGVPVEANTLAELRQIAAELGVEAL
ncbi:MAG: Ldh family oxidoreductase [Clostridia bacterium]|nr:Ldh family oxidoreductase [Clostridia bacterium]